MSAASAAAPAAPKPMKILDAANDGNALNGQGVEPTDPVATPVQVAGTDIRSVSWVTTVVTKKVGKKLVNVPTGMKVIMALGAAPQKSAIFRVTTTSGPCEVFWLNYAFYASSAPRATLQHDCPGFAKATPASTSEFVPVTAKVAGSTITWTVKAREMPKAVPVGAKVFGLSAEARTILGDPKAGSATAPVIDEAAGKGTYTYGR